MPVHGLDALTQPNRISTALKRAAIVLAVTVSGLAAAQPAQAAGNLEVALQDDAVFSDERYFDRERALDLARRLNVTRIRVNVLWASSLIPEQRNAARQPQTEVFDFTKIDQLIDAAAARGIRIEASLTGPAPRYASGNGRVDFPIVRPNAALYSNFVRAAALHFRGRIDRYLVWNEPNVFDWLSPGRSGPAIYRSLYSAAYPAIKNADNSAQVLIGVTAPYALRGRQSAPLDFIRRVFCVNEDFRRTRRCPALTADGYAHHPYDFQRPIGPPNRDYPPRGCSRRSCPDAEDAATLGTLNRLNRTLSRLKRARVLKGRANSRIYLTEYGYFRKGQRRLPESRRAKYLRDGFQRATRLRGVRQLLQYGLLAVPRGTPGDFFDLGIVETNGTPMRSFNSLAAWSRRARIKKPPANVQLPPAPPPIVPGS